MNPPPQNTLSGAVDATPWIETLARLGYFCKGAVYVLVGIIAVRAALDMSETSPSSGGAFSSLLTQPFGRVLLGVIAVGLFGYVLWRFAQAVFDPERRGSNLKGMAYRIYCAGSGLVHSAVAVQALRVAFSDRGSDDERTAQQASGLMAQEGGVLVVGLLGAVAAGYGIGQLVRAWRSDIGQQFQMQEVSAAWRDWVLRLSRFGMASRGVVFFVVGWFLVQAARQNDPSEARGIAGALKTIEQSAYGPWLAALVAFGLVSYGIFTLLKGRYRRIEPI